jgi:hypothetical protein
MRRHLLTAFLGCPGRFAPNRPQELFASFSFLTRQPFLAAASHLFAEYALIQFCRALWNNHMDHLRFQPSQQFSQAEHFHFIGDVCASPHVSMRVIPSHCDATQNSIEG